jgi:hypothetical protein
MIIQSQRQVVLSSKLDNKTQQRLHDGGFVKVCEYFRYRANIHSQKKQELTDFRELQGEAHAQAIVQFLTILSPMPENLRNVVYKHQRCTPITLEWMLVHSHQVYSWHGIHNSEHTVDGLVIGGGFIHYMDAQPGYYAVLASAVRREFAITQSMVMIPNRPQYMVAIEQAGWRRKPSDDDYKMTLFEKKLTFERHNHETTKQDDQQNDQGDSDSDTQNH